MTERSSARPKRGDDSKASRKPSAARASAVGASAAETARLKSDLAAAQKRIAELEQRQTDIVNRIDWVIDSLHNLTDE